MSRAFVLGLFALCACREHDAPIDARPVDLAHPAPTTRILYPSAPGSFVDLVANAKHGVVAIRAKTPVKSGPAAMYPGAPESAPDVALGTGFLVESQGVYIVTNDHVIAASPAQDIEVVLPGAFDAVPAKVIGRDPRLDLALLSVDVPRLQPLALGNSDDLHVGEWVVALGDAFGDEVTASAGIVSATGREAAGSLAAGRALGFRTFIATDARIHRGNSGGPLIDTSGQVVGVAVATGDRATEMSFAIPINRVREVLDALREHGAVAHGWLGVMVKPVTPELASQLSLAVPAGHGAYVTDIIAGSPAARANLRAGDVILKWDGKDIDHRTLPWIVAASPVERQTTVDVWRDRAPLSVVVVTSAMPE